MHFPLTMPGSKRRTFPQILPHVPVPDLGGGTLIPFFGTGADAQYLHNEGHKLVRCGDGNPHLCKLYNQLRAATAATMAAVTRLVAVFPRDLDGQRAWYIDTRAQYNAAHVAGIDTPDSAALFLAVWRTAFNGLARANARGLINSPAGMAASNGPKKSLVDLKALSGFAEWLAAIPPVECADYVKVLHGAVPGDTVYLDPPYVGTFDGYFGKGFDTDRLVQDVRAIPGDVAWALSNAVSPRWASDFPDATQIMIRRAGTVSCKASTRDSVPEVLIVQRRSSETREETP